MAVCSFLGHSGIYDADIDAVLQTAVEQLSVEYGYVDFWIYPHGKFTERCLLAALRAKTHYPTRVTITLAVPLIRSEDYSEQNISGIPFCMIDKVITHEVPPPSQRDYSVSYKKMMQWIMENSTHLICYIYKNIYTQENQLLKIAKNKSKAEIISITNAETKQFIMESSVFMSDRERFIFNKMNEGKRPTEAAALVGLSIERSRQVLYHGCKMIRRKLDWRYYKTLTEKDQRGMACGIFGIGEATEETLSSFIHTVSFLIFTYGIKDFYVEYSCARSDFVHALTSCTTLHHPIHITAVTGSRVHPESHDAPGNIAEAVCPPCDALECIGWTDRDNTSDNFRVIADIADRSDFCICNTSAYLLTTDLQKHVFQNKTTILLDLSKGLIK